MAVDLWPETIIIIISKVVIITRTVDHHHPTLHRTRPQASGGKHQPNLLGESWRVCSDQDKTRQEKSVLGFPSSNKKLEATEDIKDNNKRGQQKRSSFHYRRVPHTCLVIENSRVKPYHHQHFKLLRIIVFHQFIAAVLFDGCARDVRRQMATELNEDRREQTSARQSTSTRCWPAQEGREC